MKEIIDQIANQAMNRSKVCMGTDETNYPFAFGWMNSELSFLLDEILTVKQKKKLQEMVNRNEVNKEV